MINSCFVGDVRDGLRAMIAAGVRAQTCVCSPPYWGLRDYGTAEWEGGADDCDHTATRRGHSGDEKQATSAGTSRDPIRGGDCRLCGARRVDKQLGLEPTPQEYVERMVEVFRLVRDVLADDGTLWLNLGDSYSTGGSGQNFSAEHGSTANSTTALGGYGHRKQPPVNGMNPKNLVGIPWRVAFALQADGWYLRSDIIWSKPNPMPESVTDRPTKAHEYMFLLAKSERYFYDADAISEPAVFGGEELGIMRGGGKVLAESMGRQPSGNELAAVRRRRESKARGEFNGKTNALKGREAFRAIKDRRNKRTVWTIATQPYADAHLAVMPRALVEPCILAGSRVGDVVLDPFLGSGTVAQVAQDLGRQWIGCELNPGYVAMQAKRTAQQGLALDAARGE